LSHIEKETAVTFFDAAHEPAKTAQVTGFLAVAAPRDIVGAFALRKIGQFGRLLAIVEKLVERHFHGPRQLFESFDRRNGMTVFDARDVAAKQPRALFDVALGQFFRFT
jgi:hypothetical protein